MGQTSNCQQQDISEPMLLCSWEPITARQNTRHSFQAQDARSKMLGLIFTQCYCLSSLSSTLRKWDIPRWRAIIFQRNSFLWKSDDRSFQLNRNKRLVRRAKAQVMIKQEMLYFVKKWKLLSASTYSSVCSPYHALWRKDVICVICIGSLAELILPSLQD